jgi:iron(III) transport system permease protein
VGTQLAGPESRVDVRAEPAPAGGGPGQRLRRSWERLRRDPFFGGAAAVLAVLVVVFILAPVLAVFVASVRGPDGLTLERYRQFFASAYYRTSLRNSLIVGLGSTTLAIAFAIPLALYVTRSRGWLARSFRVISLLPLVAPPFIFALALIALGGRRGLISQVINPLLGTQFSIFGLHGIILAQVLGFFPVAYMLVESALRSIDPSLEHASRDLGASQVRTVLRVTLPLARSGIIKAYLIVFVLVLADFSNPIIIGGGRPTLASDAYLLIVGRQNLEMAAVVAVFLVLPSIVVFLIQRHLLKGAAGEASIGSSAGGQNVPLNPGLKAACLAASVVVVALIVVLFSFVVAGAFVRVLGVNNTFTLEHFATRRGWSYIQNSLVVSLGAAFVAAALGVVQGYVLARKPVPAKGLQEFSSLFGLAVPGTVIGIGYVLVFHGPPLNLTGTMLILVLNMAFRNVGVAMTASISKLHQIDTAFEEASADLGAGPVRTFGQVAVPLLLPAFMAGFVYTFMTTMVTVSSVIFLVSPGTNLAAVYILNLANTAAIGEASAMSFMLIVVVLACLGALRWLERRSNLGL